MVDPTKEIAAMKDMVRSGFQSLSETVRQLGEDPVEHFDEMAADNELIDSLQLKLDSDPRSMTNTGQSQMAFSRGMGIMGQPQIKNEVKIGMFQIRADLRPATFDNKKSHCRCSDELRLSGTALRFHERWFLSGRARYFRAAIRTVVSTRALPVLTNHSRCQFLSNRRQWRTSELSNLIKSKMEI
jgi:hypothetical protein